MVGNPRRPVLGARVRNRSPRRRQVAFVGRGPHGEGPEFYGVYREVAAPGRVVFTEIYAAFPDVESVVTAVLTEELGKTRLTATCLYPSIEVRDAVIKSGMERGAAISYDRLEDVASQLQGV